MLVDTGCYIRTRVAQDLGSGFQVSALAQDMGCKGVAESVRRELPCDARLSFCAAKAILDA